jgi:hypothetical protein
MANSFEDIFHFMQAHGFYQDCATYQEYREKHLGIVDAPEESEEEGHSKDFIDWLNEMPQEEKKDFLYAFGDD